MNNLPPPLPSLSKNGAFTLIELLTVIAIIGILAAIMIPTLGAVRKKANTAKTIANLKQIYTGFILYANDNKDDICPYDQYAATEPERRFSTKLAPYVNQSVKLIQNKDSKQSLFYHPLAPTHLSYGDYVITVQCSRANAQTPPHKFSDFPTPQLQLLCAPVQGVTNGAGHINNPASIGQWHDGKAVLLFLDGKVQFRDKLDAANTGFWKGEPSP